MTRLQRILVVIFLASQPGIALGERAPAEPQAKPEKPRALQPSELNELSKRLDDIVNRALDAEVLDPPVSEAPRAIRTDDCSVADPLNFSAFTDVSDYASLQAFLQAADAPGAKPSPHRHIETARAWLAVGLTTEAVAKLEGAQDAGSDALRTIAALIEGRTRNDLNAFRNLAYCHDTAAIWLGSALLINDAPEGAVLLSDRVADIRALPLQLRVKFVSAAIPGLVRQGDKQLAMKLMAVFTEEEIGKSSDLRFCRAQLAHAEGKSGAHEEILWRVFSRRSQSDALAVLIQAGEAWTPAQSFVLKQDAIGLIARHRSESELFRYLKFLLDREGEEAGYKALAGLLDTTLKSGGARDAALNMVTERLKSDLNSEAPVIALSAVQFLKDRPDLFKGLDEEAQIYDLAIRKAAALGYDTLSLSLAEGTGSEEMRDALAASVAFRRKDYETVFELARTRPDQDGVQLLAARAAIRTGDAARFDAAGKAMTLTPDNARILINEDVISGHWIVSDAIYALANKDADDAAQARLAQIGKIRAARNTKPPEAEPHSAAPEKDEKAAAGKEMHE